MKRIACLIALLAAAAMLCAQGTETAQDYLTGSEPGDILLVDLGAFGGGFAAVGLNFLALWALGADGTASPADAVLGSAVTELSDIPLFLGGSPDSLALSLGGAALLGAEALARFGYGPESETANLLYWGKINLTMYKAYDAYASARLRSPAWDNSGFARHGPVELMAASLDPMTYAKPQAWIALGLGIGSTFAMTAVQGAGAWDDAVWATGKFYREGRQTTAGAFFLENALADAVSAAYTGMGEEAVYRGFMHEELSARLGRPWAYAIDTSAFLAMHLLTDLARGMAWYEIGTHLAFVAAGNLLYDWAYDEGGLPLAAASHALYDLAAFLIQDMIDGGAPASIAAP